MSSGTHIVCFATGKVGTGRRPCCRRLCHIGLSNDNLGLLAGKSCFRHIRISSSTHFIISGCSHMGAIPYTVLLSAGNGGMVSVRRDSFSRLFTTNCGFPRVFGMGTTSNIASLCNIVCGPFGFSSAGICPVISCICPKPRIRNICCPFAHVDPHASHLTRTKFVIVSIKRHNKRPDHSG